MQSTKSSSDIKLFLKFWWKMLPSLSKLLVFLLVPIYISTYFAHSSLESALVSTENSLLRLQLWKLLTAPLFQDKLFSLLVQLLSFLMLASRQERLLGTVRYALLLVVNTVVVELALAVGMLGLSVVPVELLRLHVVHGLWPLIMVELTIRYNRTPDDPTHFFICPFEMKAKYFPWLFLLFFSLSQQVYSLLVGLIVGYLRNS